MYTCPTSPEKRRVRVSRLPVWTQRHLPGPEQGRGVHQLAAAERTEARGRGLRILGGDHARSSNPDPDPNPNSHPSPNPNLSEATRTVYLAAQREKSSITDAETICSFTRGGGGGGAGAGGDGSGGGGGEVVMARQRVLRFLTPNPNSAEGVMWSEAGGRAVASLEYELRLERLGQARGLS